MGLFLGLLPVLCAFVIPFISVTRGGSVIKAFFLAWGSILVSLLIFTLAIPLILYKIDHDISHRWSNCFPEPPLIIAMIFFGWFYAGIPVLIAMGFRKCVVWKRAGKRELGNKP